MSRVLTVYREYTQAAPLKALKALSYTLFAPRSLNAPNAEKACSYFECSLRGFRA